MKIQEVKEKSPSVEDVFYDLSESQVRDLMFVLEKNTGKSFTFWCAHVELDDLLDVYTFREIRVAMKELNFI